jgi:LPXTG-motif cell wall-anchored protein
MKKFLAAGGVAACIIIGFISMFGLTASAAEDDTTTTTQAPYEPAVRGPQVVEERTPDPCLIDGERVDEWVPVAWPDNQGTTEFGFIPCARVPAVVTPVVEAAPTTTTQPQRQVEVARALPSTGPSDYGWPIALIASAFIGAGGALVLVGRGRS